MLVFHHPDMELQPRSSARQSSLASMRSILDRKVLSVPISTGLGENSDPGRTRLIPPGNDRTWLLKYLSKEMVELLGLRKNNFHGGGTTFATWSILKENVNMCTRCVKRSFSLWGFISHLFMLKSCAFIYDHIYIYIHSKVFLHAFVPVDD